jgi:GT2 family glycosyltransferase
VTLSILIVNWNSKDLLMSCLASIRATCGELTPQVVVVDGGSFDGCAEMLAEHFPEVVFVQSDENIGFGRSNNLGFSRVKGEAVLLLNPDTEVRAGAVQRLMLELQHLSHAGLLGSRLLNSDLTLQNSVHALPKPVRQALDSEALRRLLSRLSLWAPPTDFAPAESVEVEAVSGACMLLKSSTFRDVGGFSPAYFMFAEDMDLCLKIRRRGLKIYHVPAAEILHHSGASSAGQGSTFSTVMMREALLTYMRLNYGLFGAAVYRFFSGVSAVIRLVMAMPALALSSDVGRTQVRASIAKSRAILSWSLGLERWVRRYSTTSESVSARPLTFG